VLELVESGQLLVVDAEHRDLTAPQSGGLPAPQVPGQVGASLVSTSGTAADVGVVQVLAPLRSRGRNAVVPDPPLRLPSWPYPASRIDNAAGEGRRAGFWCPQPSLCASP